MRLLLVVAIFLGCLAGLFCKEPIPARRTALICKAVALLCALFTRDLVGVILTAVSFADRAGVVLSDGQILNICWSLGARFGREWSGVTPNAASLPWALYTLLRGYVAVTYPTLAWATLLDWRYPGVLAECAIWAALHMAPDVWFVYALLRKPRCFSLDVGLMLDGLFAALRRWRDDVMENPRPAMADARYGVSFPTSVATLQEAMAPGLPPLAVGLLDCWPEGVEVGPFYTGAASIAGEDFFYRRAMWYMYGLSKGSMSEFMAAVDKLRPSSSRLRCGPIRVRSCKYEFEPRRARSVTIGLHGTTGDVLPGERWCRDLNDLGFVARVDYSGGDRSSTIAAGSHDLGEGERGCFATACSTMAVWADSLREQKETALYLPYFVTKNVASSTLYSAAPPREIRAPVRVPVRFGAVAGICEMLTDDVFHLGYGVLSPPRFSGFGWKAVIAAPGRRAGTIYALGSSSYVAPAGSVDVRALGFCDHAIIFRRYERVISHGGSGTMYDSLCAGCVAQPADRLIDRDWNGDGLALINTSWHPCRSALATMYASSEDMTRAARDIGAQSLVGYASFIADLRSALVACILLAWLFTLPLAILRRVGGVVNTYLRFKDLIAGLRLLAAQVSVRRLWTNRSNAIFEGFRRLLTPDNDVLLYVVASAAKPEGPGRLWARLVGDSSEGAGISRTRSAFGFWLADNYDAYSSSLLVCSNVGVDELVRRVALYGRGLDKKMASYLLTGGTGSEALEPVVPRPLTIADGWGKLAKAGFNVVKRLASDNGTARDKPAWILSQRIRPYSELRYEFEIIPPVGTGRQWTDAYDVLWAISRRVNELAGEELMSEMEFKRHFNTEAPNTPWIVARRARLAARLGGEALHDSTMEYVTAASVAESFSRYTKPAYICSEVAEAMVFSAADKLVAAHGQIFDNHELQSVYSVWKRTVKKYAATLPFEGQKVALPDGGMRLIKTKRDIQRTPNLLGALLDLVKTDLANGAVRPQVHHVFPKLFTVDPVKIRENPAKLRTIVAQCAPDLLRDGVFNLSLNKALVKHGKGLGIFPGQSLTSAGLLAAFEDVETWGQHIALDGTAFDANCPTALIKGVAHMRKAGFVNHPQRVSIEAWLDANYANLEKGFGVNLVDGSSMEKLRGFTTGSSSVTADNSLALQLAIRTALALQIGDAAFDDTQCRLTNAGDDHVISLHKLRVDSTKLAAQAEGLFGIEFRVEGEGDTLDGIEFLRKTRIVMPTEDAALLARHGIYHARGYVHDRELLMARVSRPLRSGHPIHNWERTLGHIALTAHSPECYALIKTELDFLRPLVARCKGGDRVLARYRVPSYEEVLLLQYKTPIGQDTRQLTVFASMEIYMRKAVGAYDAIRSAIIAFKMNASSATDIIIGSGRYPTVAFPAVGLHALGRVGSNPAELRRSVMKSMFSHVVDVQYEVDTALEMGLTHTRRGTAVVMMALMLGQGFAAWVSQPASNPLTAAVKRIWSLLAIDAGQMYAIFSSFAWLVQGGAQGGATRLIAKDPFGWPKFVAYFVAESITPRSVEALPIDFALDWLRPMCWIEGFFASNVLRTPLDRAISASAPIMAAAEAVAVALKEHDTVLLTAATGTGKTYHVPAWLLQYYARVFVLVPRRLLVKTARDSYTRIVDHEPYPLEGVVVTTYGLFAYRLRCGLTMTSADVVLADEIHENSADQVETMIEMAADMKLVYMTATPANVFSFGLRKPSQTIAGPSASPYPVTRHMVARTWHAALTEFDRGERTLIIFPTKKEAQAALETLIANQFDAGVLYAGVEVPAVRVLCATSVVDAGITLPDLELVIDAGFRLVNHRGELQRRPVDMNLSTQRAGRTGRTRPGRYVLLHAPDDGMVVPYPSFPAFVRNSVTWCKVLGHNFGLGGPISARFDSGTTIEQQAALEIKSRFDNAKQLLEATQYGIPEEVSALTDELGLTETEVRKAIALAAHHNVELTDGVSRWVVGWPRLCGEHIVGADGYAKPTHREGVFVTIEGSTYHAYSARGVSAAADLAQKLGFPMTPFEVMQLPDPDTGARICVRRAADGIGGAGYELFTLAHGAATGEVGYSEAASALPGRVGIKDMANKTLYQSRFGCERFVRYAAYRAGLISHPDNLEELPEVASADEATEPAVVRTSNHVALCAGATVDRWWRVGRTALNWDRVWRPHAEGAHPESYALLSAEEARAARLTVETRHPWVDLYVDGVRINQGEMGTHFVSMGATENGFAVFSHAPTGLPGSLAMPRFKARGSRPQMADGECGAWAVAEVLQWKHRMAGWEMTPQGGRSIMNSLTLEGPLNNVLATIDQIVGEELLCDYSEAEISLHNAEDHWSVSTMRHDDAARCWSRSGGVVLKPFPRPVRNAGRKCFEGTFRIMRCLTDGTAHCAQELPAWANEWSLRSATALIQRFRENPVSPWRVGHRWGGEHHPIVVGCGVSYDNGLRVPWEIELSDSAYLAVNGRWGKPPQTVASVDTDYTLEEVREIAKRFARGIDPVWGADGCMSDLVLVGLRLNDDLLDRANNVTCPLVWTPDLLSRNLFDIVRYANTVQGVFWMRKATRDTYSPPPRGNPGGWCGVLTINLVAVANGIDIDACALHGALPPTQPSRGEATQALIERLPKGEDGVVHMHGNHWWLTAYGLDFDNGMVWPARRRRSTFSYGVRLAKRLPGTAFVVTPILIAEAVVAGLKDVFPRMEGDAGETRFQLILRCPRLKASLNGSLEVAHCSAFWEGSAVQQGHVHGVVKFDGVSGALTAFEALRQPTTENGVVLIRAAPTFFGATWSEAVALATALSQGSLPASVLVADWLGNSDISFEATMQRLKPGYDSLRKRIGANVYVADGRCTTTREVNREGWIVAQEPAAVKSRVRAPANTIIARAAARYAPKAVYAGADGSGVTVAEAARYIRRHGVSLGEVPDGNLDFKVRWLNASLGCSKDMPAVVIIETRVMMYVDRAGLTFPQGATKDTDPKLRRLAEAARRIGWGNIELTAEEVEDIEALPGNDQENGVALLECTGLPSQIIRFYKESVAGLGAIIPVGAFHYVLRNMRSLPVKYREEMLRSVLRALAEDWRVIVIGRRASAHMLDIVHKERMCPRRELAPNARKAALRYLAAATAAVAANGRLHPSGANDGPNSLRGKLRKIAFAKTQTGWGSWRITCLPKRVEGLECESGFKLPVRTGDAYIIKQAYIPRHALSWRGGVGYKWTKGCLVSGAAFLSRRRSPPSSWISEFVGAPNLSVGQLWAFLDACSVGVAVYTNENVVATKGEWYRSFAHLQGVWYDVGFESPKLLGRRAAICADSCRYIVTPDLKSGEYVVPLFTNLPDVAELDQGTKDVIKQVSVLARGNRVHDPRKGDWAQLPPRAEARVYSYRPMGSSIDEGNVGAMMKMIAMNTR